MKRAQNKTLVVLEGQQKRRNIVVWRFKDGITGHERQTEGLVAALQQLAPITCHTFDVRTFETGLHDYLLGRFRPGRGLPLPSLLIGAGRATHLPLVAARRSTKGRSILLMKPSLPTHWFDLCLIPEHDGVEASNNVVITQGVLNTIQPSKSQLPDQGLILLGGPSRHYHWDDQQILGQIEVILRRSPQVFWRITDSRRTPTSSSRMVAQLNMQNLQYLPRAETSPTWVAKELDRAGLVWVTEDSMSMVYEAVTAGGNVGLITLPKKKISRITKSIEMLNKGGFTMTFGEWQDTKMLRPVPYNFCESERCARIIYDLWLKDKAETTLQQRYLEGPKITEKPYALTKGKV